MDIPNKFLKKSAFIFIQTHINSLNWLGQSIQYALEIISNFNQMFLVIAKHEMTNDVNLIGKNALVFEYFF